MRSTALPALLSAFILGATACDDSPIDHLTEPTGLLPTSEPLPEGDATLAQAITDLDFGSCRFGDPVEIDEYNGLIYGSGGRWVPGPLLPQIVDMWKLSIYFVGELPDDISWICNPFELEQAVELELAAHDDHPDDITHFGLVEIHDDVSSTLPSWYLAYQPPPGGESPNDFRRKMVLKLWDLGNLFPLLDSVQVTVTACFHPAFKHQCIQNELGDL